MSCCLCSVACANNHQFDRARQGCLNLLPGNKKRSKQPGDDQAMVAARARFLNHGYYQRVTQTLLEVLQSFGPSGQYVLDAGCGEGYYTSAVRAHLADGQLVARQDMVNVSNLVTRLDMTGSKGQLSGSMNVGKGVMKLSGHLDWQQLPGR